ncbi:MAG TPA: ATP-grasp domain-containing protein [Allosphingosinicella sp.]|nr:ATP-grasp domain-containing protein [Allosphingosinicella sp.]
MSERILLLGDDIGVFLAVARSLGRRGLEVHVVPAELDNPALASRYIAGVHALPSYHLGPARWVEELRGLADQHDFALIIPCSDAGLQLLHEHRPILGPERLLLPNEEAFDAFTDKAKTRALAARLCIRVARGRKAGTDADALAAELGLPLVLKPCSSYRPGDAESKQRAEVVRYLPHLREALARGRDHWLAESFVPGVGVGVSVLGRRGDVLLAVQHRRLKTLSETGGGSVRVTEAVDPVLLADVRKLAEAVALTGVAMFEFRQDRGRGRHVLLEVNARFWGSLPLAVAARADFPALVWDAHCGRGVAPGAPRAGIRKTNLRGEMDRVSTTLKGGGPGKAGALVSLAGLLATLPFPARFDSWAADDPAPWREERKAVLARLRRSVSSRRGTSPQRAAITRPAT